MNKTDVKLKFLFFFVMRRDTDIFSFGSHYCFLMGALHTDIAEFGKPERMRVVNDILLFAG